MMPVIFSVGPITLYSFGVCLFVGFFLALFVIWKKGREENFEEVKMFDVVLLASFWALIAARVGYIILNFDLVGNNPVGWFNLIGRPGYSYHAAFLGGLASLIRECKKRKWDFFEFADIVSIGVSVFTIFVWLGAFLNGYGYGKVTESFLGLNFPGLEGKRFPVQLYGMASYLGIFSYLWWVEGRYRTFEWYKAYKSSARSGFILFNFFILAGLTGTLLSFLSQDGLKFWFIRMDILFWFALTLVGVTGIWIRSSKKWRHGLTIFKKPKYKRNLTLEEKYGKDIF